jgi:hypothetical protein
MMRPSLRSNHFILEGRISAWKVLRRRRLKTCTFADQLDRAFGAVSDVTPRHALQSFWIG